MIVRGAELDGTPIAALATPPGTSALAVIRVSGDDALQRVLPMLQRPDGQAVQRESFTPRLLRRLNLLAEGEVLDQAMVVFFPAPHSYTGEEVVELQLHGSPVVAHAVLEQLRQCGFRPAQPGEFTRRAFLNNKMDLTQAEAVAALIHSATPRAAREAVRQLDGTLSMRIGQARHGVLEILAHLEAGLDFADEDIAPWSDGGLLRAVSTVLTDLGGLLRSAQQGIRLQDGFHWVIAGRPNVGKSSLFNRMLGRKRALVAPHPGTTRDCIESQVELAGMPVILTDTAGLRVTDEPVEAEGIAVTRAQLTQADGILLVMDAQQGLTAADQELLTGMPDGLVIAVWNKIDLGIGELPVLTGVEAVQVSAVTGMGFEGLERLMVARMMPVSLEGAGALVMAVRQKEALERAVHALAECEAWMVHGKPAEAVALPVRAALAALGELSGEVTHDELLDRIFATFCIGK
ncbi:MAG: tRNA uridine-5-carboxymethylaminomethyl(34) synthesis GTPase MnmE [Magnetococcales bacterium]|nr:tRNA uridine-5-carboxymethylaminomethyl(34) synthesis GTPase MnmE [Magnetococcales bacterium]NGZ06371.1 tRNA uridine-5-carboxymethylaminomethyl(34) synthesis GTPase MnmE [Magnetococcales bacterium]